MKRKCPCGEIHDFERIRRFKTTFGGTTSHYQFFCTILGKLMILTTTTYPPSLTASLCPHTALKKFSKQECIMESDAFFQTVYCHAIE